MVEAGVGVGGMWGVRGLLESRNCTLAHFFLISKGSAGHVWRGGGWGGCGGGRGCVWSNNVVP